MCAEGWGCVAIWPLAVLAIMTGRFLLAWAIGAALHVQKAAAVAPLASLLLLVLAVLDSATLRLLAADAARPIAAGVCGALAGGALWHSRDQDPRRRSAGWEPDTKSPAAGASSGQLRLVMASSVETAPGQLGLAILVAGSSGVIVCKVVMDPGDSRVAVAEPLCCGAVL